MENASKALLMAAAALIGILFISFVVYIASVMKDNTRRIKKIS